MTVYFKGKQGRPKFKGRSAPPGFTLPEKVRIRDNRIAIPKLGWYRLQRKGGNPYPGGKPKQAVFKCETGKWFCTVFYQVEQPVREDDGTVIGVDRNVRQCATDTGDIFRLPDQSRLEAKRKRYQRRMTRQTRGSKRRDRTRAKLAKTARKMANARFNWCHQTSRHIADAARTVVIEDLNTKGMTASGGSRKRGLNRGIRESGWSQLEHHLEYKAGRLIRVDPAYTSQTCNACGHVDKANRPTQAQFRCQACGHEANADVNAAANIRRLGMAQLDGEGRGCSNARPVTRQIGGERLAA